MGIDANAVLLRHYSDIPEPDRQLMHDWLQSYAKHTPLEGKKVLVNVHQDRITALMIDCLMQLGATVEAAQIDVSALSEAALVFQDANIPFYTSLGDIPDEEGHYDVIIDCGGPLAHLKPKLGAVELTHTPRETYQRSEKPVVSVNNGKVKDTETRYGTGVACVDTLRDFFATDMDYSFCSDDNSDSGLSDTEPHKYALGASSAAYGSSVLSDKTYLIFGYGNVGSGIVKALINEGVPPSHITVAETNRNAISKGESRYKDVNFVLGTNKDTIGPIHQDVVLTATGVPGLLTNLGYTPLDIRGYIGNMGNPDEIGKNFPDGKVIGGQKTPPMNFSLEREYATPVPFLVPSFTALLAACVDLTQNKTYKPGLNPLPNTIDTHLLARFLNHHGRLVPGIAQEFSSAEARALVCEQINLKRGFTPPSMSSCFHTYQPPCERASPKPSPQPTRQPSAGLTKPVS